MCARAADEDLAPFNVVAIGEGSASLFTATVTMRMPPFVRHQSVLTSTYSAQVFPYFFFSEKGRISITIPEEDLRKVAIGRPIDFAGKAYNEAGEGRRIEGHAVPTGPGKGRIQVRVYISRRISITYNTTYFLPAYAAPSPR